MAFLVHSYMHWRHGPMENTFCVWPRMKSIKVKEKEYNVGGIMYLANSFSDENYIHLIHSYSIDFK